MSRESYEVSEWPHIRDLLGLEDVLDEAIQYETDTQA